MRVCKICTTYGCGAEQRGPRPGSLSGITSDTLFILLHAAAVAVAGRQRQGKGGKEKGGVKMQPKGASVSPSVIFCQVSETDEDFLSLAVSSVKRCSTHTVPQKGFS